MKNLLFTQRRLIHHSMAKVADVIVFCVFIFCSHFSFSQNPLVKVWDKDFGGTDYDVFPTIQQSAEGGFIIGGYSGSGIGGDKTQDNCGCGTDEDFWIIKTDSLGNKIWDKDFGGTGGDRIYSLHQTLDRGYIFGGSSWSGISCDKTENLSGGQDYWLLKTDSLGNKLWDKDFGGTGDDFLRCIKQTSDGGYILGGWSESDSSGDKTQAKKGGADYWIIKIDSLGNKIWDKDFGGTSWDYLYSLQQTSDGGFILGGWTYSDAGGDKTQPLWGSTDYWIIKTDSFGNKEWDKDFGGTSIDLLKSIQQTFDGGFILGGSSLSGISGDKTQNTWSVDTTDYWIVKTDALGNKLWDKDFGGTDFEQFGYMNQTADSGFILGGDTPSGISGDKTQVTMGFNDYWIVKTDSIGNKQWDFDLGGTSTDELLSLQQTTDGGYILCGQSGSGLGGDKTQPNQGGGDYWIVKLMDSTLTTDVSNTEKANEQLLLSPNPTENKFTIGNMQFAINSIEIYNMLGVRMQ